MRFVFTRRFYALLAAGFLLLSLSWQWPTLRRLTLAYDLLLLAAAFVDARLSRWPAGVTVKRELGGRFHLGAETEVRVLVQNEARRTFRAHVKDEYPPELRLASPREVELSVEGQTSATLVYGLTPPRRGRYEFGRMAVRYRSRLGLVWVATEAGEAQSVKVYPNLRR
ncbi:MAG TPA: hypothetical protein VE775_08770, partial [Pyrinomonadaceae bacterium]|nr:hypothetical protein [Pyrinomonadaceae bacterium]